MELRRLDVSIKRAAEQRSELRPGRGFASLGLWFVRFGSREAATEFITGSDLPVIPVAPPGSITLGALTQGSQSPTLGLILTAATQLGVRSLNHSGYNQLNPWLFRNHSLAYDAASKGFQE